MKIFALAAAILAVIGGPTVAQKMDLGKIVVEGWSSASLAKSVVTLGGTPGSQVHTGNDGLRNERLRRSGDGQADWTRVGPSRT
jgi:hypothetical protein